MHTYVDGLDRFLGDHHNEVVVGLALVVLAEAVIIWLWARRAAILRHRLAAAEEAAGSAATHAAAALAVDALRPAERVLEAASVAAQPAFTAAAPVEAPAPRQELYSAPATVSAPQPALYTPPAPEPAAARASSAPDLYAPPVTPVETAAALRAAAAASQPEPAATGVAAWTLEAAAQIPPVSIEERLAGLGGVAAWTETEPLAASSAAWTWGSPATPATPATPAAAVAAAPGTDTAVNLLLVEDDVNVAKLYRMLLESRGYTVRHAADGVEGLDAARRQRPDLILLDVMMPRMNGISFLQALREDATLGAVPAVVLSNFREPRLVERAMALGALEYMVKAQTRPETLVGAIPHWLKGERVVTA
jgi:CheY-like chemotaxis protein